MENIKKVGRPKLKIDTEKLNKEIEKYLKGQKAISTYRNLDISKSSFYRILDLMEVKR